MSEGGWPTELMYDELSLQVRRRVVQHLHGIGLGLAGGRQRSILAERRARGAVLQREVLEAALGPRDAAFLNSELAFGVGGFRLRSELPQVLSFGHDVGAALHAHFGGD